MPMTRFTSASSRSISPPPPLPTRKRTPKSAKGASTRKPAAARGGAARGLASRASTGPTKEQFDDLKRQIEELKKSNTQPPAPAAQVRLSPRSKTPKARPRSETPARPKSPQHRSSRSRGAKRSTPRTRAPRSPEPSAWSPQHRPRSSARSPQHTPSARSEPRRRSPRSPSPRGRRRRSSPPKRSYPRPLRTASAREFEDQTHRQEYRQAEYRDQPTQPHWPQPQPHWLPPYPMPPQQGIPPPIYVINPPQYPPPQQAPPSYPTWSMSWGPTPPSGTYPEWWPSRGYYGR